MESWLEARGVTFRHPRGAEGEVGVEGVDLAVGAGEVVALIGPSGGGKTTLVRLFAGLTRPDAGELYLAGRPYAELDLREVRRRVGLLGQVGHMFPGTVAANVATAARLAGNDPAAVDVAHWLAAVGLDAVLAERPAVRLSVGQQQRVALARLLAMGPRWLLLDEPTAALDPTSSGVIEALLARLRDAGMGILLVTHELDLARRLAERVAILAGGRVVEAGRAESVLSRTEDPALNARLHGEGPG
ncbi:MAG: hypothetical protein COW73_11650 [Nitrospirae bacterium CG18_big_fil_WC_8_21_14_2_50_70_55]|nr:amino acid ABC transporter ATP-binding protein [Deltaproteobacteria bacterium]OIP67473.1 MAG: hypothetical protein AUK30_00645 [Nitrospirae bacterium CG2_30_70_394]PIQ03165.1 MAG: hypothetical protein COW73_11650 [Nitrospirae bacterium CG18_big_fil_WC_8_21_14_2_50_70_55]PIU77576.1 MAG: hypothetical protein COS73_09765 [Nitrospirae bacterium CG06_land_8_20_14_3_00_70_43]PIW83039.1 MAG: hypothetical protein COZ96_05505 [Nitrospirae bacterium CG_4_8_14_3_um_filter_70_85]PIX82138.1 MAG: hypothe